MLQKHQTLAEVYQALQRMRKNENRIRLRDPLEHDARTRTAMGRQTIQRELVVARMQPVMLMSPPMLHVAAKNALDLFCNIFVLNSGESASQGRQTGQPGPARR